MPAAIVTGGAVRLGRAMALHLAQKGFDIALHHHASACAAEEAARRARDLGVRCETYPCDFTDLSASEGLMEGITRDFSDIELLINNASIFVHENIEQSRTDTLRNSFHINLMTPYLLMREYKRRVNRGMIINILDERIARNVPAFAAYSVTKVGLSHLTHLGALEWGDKVRVNGIAPGLILPPAGEPADYLEREAKKIPVRDHGCPEDILRALDYLLESPFVNGETLFVDGGQSKAQRGLPQNE
ncbi:MAG: SDR family oxidoreductase [Nitrospinaceae bacterium]